VHVRVRNVGVGREWGVYVTLMESDTEEPNCRAEGGTRPGRTRKKPEDLSALRVRVGCARSETQNDDFILKVSEMILLPQNLKERESQGKMSGEMHSGRVCLFATGLKKGEGLKTVFAPGSGKKVEFRTFEKFVPSLSKKGKKMIFAVKRDQCSGRMRRTS
jgi:hypothetical protein